MRISHLFTERNNRTLDPVRIMWLIVFVHLLLLSGWMTYKGATGFKEMVEAWVLFLTTAGATIAGKSLTEPKPAPEA